MEIHGRAATTFGKHSKLRTVKIKVNARDDAENGYITWKK